MSKVTIIFILFFASTLYSQTVSTLVSGPSTFNDGLALDKEGNIFAARFYGSTVTKITPDGNTSIFATGFKDPNGIAFDNSGNLLVPSATGGRVNKVSSSGSVSLFKNISNPHAILVDKNDTIYVAHYPDNKISKIDPSGNVSTFWSGNGLNGPIGLLFDDDGNFYAGNFNDGKIFKRTPLGQISQIGDIPGWMGFMTLAGNSIYATAFQLNKIYKISLDGSGQSVFAGTGAAGQKDGDVTEATFNSPNGIVATKTGDTLYISDLESMSLRMITGLNAVTNVEAGMSKINSFELKQNYPNPFNPATTIKYSIPSNVKRQMSNVKINVYDHLGREVATLVNDYKSAGSYTVEFDASHLASGIYYYQLSAGEFIQSKKMILIK